MQYYKLTTTLQNDWRENHDNLTWNIRPTIKTIHTQEIISPWFVIMNSWLSIGAFLPVFRLLGIIPAWKVKHQRRKKEVQWCPGFGRPEASAQSATRTASEVYRDNFGGAPYLFRKKKKILYTKCDSITQYIGGYLRKNVFFKTNSSKKTRKRDATKDWTILSERRLTSNPLRKLRRPSFLPNHKSNAEGFAKEPA